MADVELLGIRKSFGPAVVLHELNLSVRSGEFMVLVGPSGCGKSTLLRLVAGLEEPSAGEVAIGGKVVTDLDPKKRGVAMVFQNYALYPHMTVRENMAFSLKLSRLPKAQIEERVAEAAKILSISEHLAKRPGQLSGGQKQRVAMGRAMVRQPAVFLFDEPLSNLDAQLRVKMRAEISLLHRRLKSTVIYVTHDQVEAMTLADRIAVMKEGRIQQVGTPLEVYHQPKTQFVASFIGTPAMNFLPWEGKTAGFRPESARLESAPGWTRMASGKTALIELLGTTAHVHVQAGNHPLVVQVPAEGAPALDASVEVWADPRGLFFFDGKGERILQGAAA